MMLSRRSQRKAGDGAKLADALPITGGEGDTTLKTRRPSQPTSLRARPLRSWVLMSALQSLKLSTVYSRVRTLPSKQHFFAVVSFLAVVYTAILRPLLIILFGPRGSPIGGALGIFVDANLRWYLFRGAVRAWEERLNEIGITLPEPPRVHSGAKLKTIPNFALGETLLRELKRQNILVALSKSASDYERQCLSSSESKGAISAAIPRVIIQPSSRLQAFASPSFELLAFSQSEMDRLVKEHFEAWFDRYQSLSFQDKEMVWTMCALYVYGGIHVSGSSGVNELVKLETAFAANSGQVSCASSVGYAIIPRDSASSVVSQILDISLLAVSPKHPLLRCMIGHIFQSKVREDIGLSFEQFRKTIDLLLKADGQEGRWVLATHECGVGDTMEYPGCCKEVPSVQVDDVLESLRRMQPSVGGASRMFVSVQHEPSDFSSRRTLNNRARVSIYERKGTPSPVMVPKVSLQEQMRRRTWCEPSWLCNRCLKAPIYGSYSRCSLVCGKCAEDIICNSPDAQTKTNVWMEVRIDNGRLREPRERLIPRIVHQTWFEELTPEKYPQLVRLQNSWRNAGWEYRFYDDASIVTYIEKNFPSRFLDAFEALQPGAYKADFFRYLVLLKEGGVYADVDVLLDTNLDTFVTPRMSFFAPRDAVGEHVRENFCLWNGFIGSAPGHPFMVRAVERMINLVLNRADFYDMEREMCKSSRHTDEVETWKSRIEPNLLLSGPCALGVSVNDAMGNGSVAKFDVGWLKPANGADTSTKNFIPGDALILMLDKTDLGALRLSDPERSFVVASTDMPGLSKTPLAVDTSLREEANGNAGSQKKERPPHYSLAGKGDWLWGTKYVYADRMVANEKIMLEITS